MSLGELEAYKRKFGYGGVAPQLCRKLRKQTDATNLRVTLTWTDPSDTYIDGALISTWKSTKIIKKAGSYPESIIDGSLVIETTVRDQYASVEYVDSDFVGGMDVGNFYYAAFPVSDTGAISTNPKNQFKDVVIYGFKIKRSGESSPKTAVTYLEDAVGMTPAYMNYSTDEFDYGDWADAFFMPRPCMLNYSGKVAYYLDPDNYAYKEDKATASDVANSSFEGNAMMEWDQIFWKFQYDSTYFYFYVSNAKYDDNFHAWSNYNYKGDLADHFYTPIYNGALVSGKLRSISGLAPLNSQTAQTEINYAVANNPGADQLWYTEVMADRMLINFLLTLISKSLDGQTAFGNGHYTGGSSAASLLTTGTLNKNGLFYGTNGTGKAVKVFGMENWWGNQWRRIAGWINASGTQKIKMTYSTNDGSTVIGYNLTGSGYINVASATPGGTSGGYINVQAPCDFGIVPCTASGSATTYYCDGLWFNNSQTDYAFVGGSSTGGLLVGPWCAALSDTASIASWGIGAAPSCKPLAS